MVLSTLDDVLGFLIQETETWKESYLPGRRQAFRFQTLRFLLARARGIVVRSEVLRLRWLDGSEVNKFWGPDAERLWSERLL
jgi:hypothetical protein